MPTDPRDADRVFDVLSHRHRRRLLVVLAEQPGEDSLIALAPLSERIATESAPDRVRLQLVHCHLPKLAETGYVRWDRDAGTVAKGPEWAVVEPFVRVLTDPTTGASTADRKRSY
ncbi:MAG: ArsR family transcriptional regulator [Haloarculaceae archaeon]